MVRLLQLLVWVDLAIVFVATAYFSGPAEDYCSRALAGDNSYFTKWDDGRVGFYHIYQPILTSSYGGQPHPNRWVKGAAQVKTITAYGVSDSAEGIHFRALDWQGVERSFLLERYFGLEGAPYGFVVRAATAPPHVNRWARLDTMTCREGVYFWMPVIAALLLLLCHFLLAGWFLADLFIAIERWAKQRLKPGGSI